MQSNTGGTAPYFNGDSWDHNTIWIADGFPFANVTPMYANSPNGNCPPFPTIPTNLFSYTNNIAPGDFLAQCEGPGGGSLSPYYSNSTFLNNALAGAVGSYANVGASNLWRSGVFPTNNAAVGYVNGTGTMSGDYHLASTSNYSAANPFFTQLATDGTDLGADIDVINMATWGAKNGGVPGPSVNVSPGSVNAVLGFNAPTTTACTPNFYPFPGPRNANTALSIATAMIQIGTYQEITVGSLTSSTTYAYTVSCDNGWIFVGTGPTALITRAAGSVSAIWPMQFGSSQTVYRSSVPNMTSACTTIGTGTTVNVPVGAGSVAYVGIAGCGANKPALKTIIAP